jgi:hypothetical protein
MMELVNGVPCFNCTDVAKAQETGLRVDRDRVDQLGARGRDPEIRDINQPLALGPRGTQINVAV